MGIIRATRSSIRFVNRLCKLAHRHNWRNVGHLSWSELEDARCSLSQIWRNVLAVERVQNELAPKAYLVRAVGRHDDLPSGAKVLKLSRLSENVANGLIHFCVM